VASTFKRIREWKKLSEGEDDVFKRFIFRWISFNGLYNAYYENKGLEGDPERRIIEKFCNDFVSGELASEIIKSAAVSNFEKNIKDESRSMGKDLNKLKNKSLPEDKRAKAAVMVAYKIRCRLFHGEKNPDLDVNREVCEAADLIISKVLEKIL